MASLSGRKPSDRKLTRGQISKVQLTGCTKMKAKGGIRLPSMIPTTRKRYRMSYFFVQCYHSWLIDARKTVGISCFRRTKKIILWWSQVVVSVLWISKAKWTQSTVHCISISRLNALKNTHGVYIMFISKPSLSRKLCLEKTHLPDYQKK